VATTKKNTFWILLLPLFLSLFSTNLQVIDIAAGQETHDIAVVRVAPSRTAVRLGELANITVVAENQGTVTEDFTVTLYYDDTIIDSKAVTTLAAGSNTTLVFSWDTTDRREEIYALDEKDKTYSIKAAAGVIEGEVDIEDNVLISSSQITVVSQYLAVLPESTVDPALVPGMNYVVSVYTDYNGTDIWSWQFTLFYNPNVLEGIEISNGELINTAKHTSAQFNPGQFNNTEGSLGLTVAFFYYQKPDVPFTTSGPGTLCSITFRVVGTGESNITLGGDNTLLTRPLPTPPYDPIIYHIIDSYNFVPSFGHVLDGYFKNTEVQVVHDMVVISVTPSSTSVQEGEIVDITVVVGNQGTVTETFDVRVHYDYKPGFPNVNVVGEVTFQSLAAGADKTLSFSWNTTDRVSGEYTITAIVPQISGETDSSNNIKASTEKVILTEQEVTPLPILEIMIVAVVIVIAIILTIWIIRRQRAKESPPEEA